MFDGVTGFYIFVDFLSAYFIHCWEKNVTVSDCNNWSLEFLLCLSGLRTWESVHEDMGLIPGLSYWVKDPVLLQAEEYIADISCIHCCCGCGIGPSCSSNLSPSPGTSISHRCGLKKEEKKSISLFYPFISVFLHVFCNSVVSWIYI